MCLEHAIGCRAVCMPVEPMAAKCTVFQPFRSLSVFQPLHRARVPFHLLHGRSSLPLCNDSNPAIEEIVCTPPCRFTPSSTASRQRWRGAPSCPAGTGCLPLGHPRTRSLLSPCWWLSLSSVTPALRVRSLALSRCGFLKRCCCARTACCCRVWAPAAAPLAVARQQPLPC